MKEVFKSISNALKQDMAFNRKALIILFYPGIFLLAAILWKAEDRAKLAAAKKLENHTGNENKEHETDGESQAVK
jgi:hypothetical protein